MPLYEYQCDACGRRFEVIQKFSEVIETCRLCQQGPVHRLLSSPAIQFKGSGWYITDYAQKGKDAPKTGGEKSGADAGKTDAAKSDSTPAPAGNTETKSESAGTSNATTPAKSSD